MKKIDPAFKKFELFFKKYSLQEVARKYDKQIGFWANMLSIISIIIATILPPCINNILSLFNDQQTINVYNGDYYDDVIIDKHNEYQYIIINHTEQSNDIMFGTSLGTEREKTLLNEAKKYIEDENYSEALRIYNSIELLNNDYAKINLGYLYAHGYGVDINLEGAKQLYESVDNDDARRNRLALLIVINNDGSYNEEIINEINYFLSIHDYYVMNYLSLCKYGKDAALLTPEEQNYNVQLSDLYCYEFIGKRYYYTGNIANSIGFIKTVNTGAASSTCKHGWTSVIYKYQLYKLQYIDWLDHIYG